jgi:transcriptional regulator with XRE-family HTH domain
MGRDTAFGRRLAELRAERGLSLRQLGARAHYSRSQLSEMEHGKKWPSPAGAAKLDEALSAGGELAALAERRPQPAGSETGLLDDPHEIDRRLRRVATSNVDEAKLHYLEAAVLRLIAEYERHPPWEMAPQVRHLRGYIDEVLAGRQHPPQQARLYAVAVHLSGLLATLAVDLGLHQHARAYGLEAFTLADAAGHPVKAWARAAQSFTAYYAGDYHEALAYAQDGQRRAPGSPHGVRLALNGEARALARLGDAYGVDAAVDRGLTLLAGYPTTVGVSAGLTLGVYCQARATANAATAYLALRQPDKVEQYATPALAVFDREGLRGPQALTRLDLATAALMAPGPDPELASRMAAEAITVSAPQRLESVSQRAHEFLTAAQPYAADPGVRAVAELVADQDGMRSIESREVVLE